MSWLFDTHLFMGRASCGPGWTYGLQLANQIANIIIFISYITIPITLTALWLIKKQQLPKTYIIVLFGHFIFFCGITHLDEVIVFFYPAYRFFTFISILTAIFSSITAILLPYTVITIIKLPSFQELYRVNQIAQEEILRRELTEEECRRSNKLLKAEVENLEALVSNYKWIDERRTTLDNIKRILEDFPL